MSKLCSQYFSSNSTWLAPAGVTKVFLLGQGGGAGGSGGINNTVGAANGGDGTTPYLVEVDVVPNTTYAITIGASGLGGSPRTSNIINGGTGGDTSFGALYTFLGARTSTTNGFSNGPASVNPVPIGIVSPNLSRDDVTFNVSSGSLKYSVVRATASGSYLGGRSGSPGFYGPPSYSATQAIGGIGNNAGAGGNATNATGFGQGGAGGGSGTTGGSGSNGGPGQLWVIWIE